MINKAKLARYRMIHFLRRPHTQQERRNNIIEPCEELTSHQNAHLVRAKRRNLPTEWDDKPVGLWTTAFAKLWIENKKKFRPSHFDSIK